MYYGWVVLAVVTLLEGLSGFGRTVALSPLLSDLCQDLSLSMTQVSSAYALSHLGAVFILPFIGRLYDQMLPSAFLSCFVALFSCSFIVLSQMAQVAAFPLLSIGLILLGYIGIRLSVHAYSIAGRSTIAVWFSHKRGLAIGLYSLFTMLIGSLMPSIIYALRGRYHWSTIWVTVGTLWFLMLFVCRLAKKPKRLQTVTADSNLTKPIRFKPFLFIFVMGTLFFKAFQNSGIMLHLFPMCADFGANERLVSFCFIPIYGVSTLATFVLGSLFKQSKARYALFLFILADLGMLLSLKLIAHAGALIAFVVFTGLYWSLNTVVATLVLPILFGVKKIGVLHGWAYAFVSLGSAAGSLYFGLMKDYASYQLSLSLCVVFAGLLLITLLCIKPNSFVSDEEAL